MSVCKREKLHQADLLSPAKKRITDKEYWANIRGKASKGDKFRTDKGILRSAIEKASSKCSSEKEFARLLKNIYG